MQRREAIKISLVLIASLSLVATVVPAPRSVTLDLAELHAAGRLVSINRDVEEKTEDKRRFVHISRSKEDGVVWLPVANFADGTIEVRARGRDVLQGSFAGIAFHGDGGQAYDNVYARPFNFRAADPVRKSHAVQYVFMPDFDWKKLRTERNGIYESGIENAPEATAWFTLRVLIRSENVSVYINNSDSPALVVEKLNQRTKGRVGRTGFNADFEYVRIVEANDRR